MDPVENMHFRLDEIERKMKQPSVTPEGIAGLVQGASAMIEQRFEQARKETCEAMAEIRQALIQDKEILKSIAESLKALADLERSERAPVTRTGTLNLPSGPVTLRIVESRQAG